MDLEDLIPAGIRFACLPVDIDSIVLVDGSSREICDGCGDPVWVAPSTRDRLHELASFISGSMIQIVCMRCMATIELSRREPVSQSMQYFSRFYQEHVA